MAKKERELTQQMKKFVNNLVATNNKTESYRKAYPTCKSYEAAAASANKLLKKPKVLAYYKARIAPTEKKDIATADEVMQFFTDVMRGKIRDQFDIEPSLADRKDAAKELAKRTIDVTLKAEVSNKLGEEGENITGVIEIPTVVDAESGGEDG